MPITIEQLGPGATEADLVAFRATVEGYMNCGYEHAEAEEIIWNNGAWTLQVVPSVEACGECGRWIVDAEGGCECSPN